MADMNHKRSKSELKHLSYIDPYTPVVFAKAKVNSQVCIGIFVEFAP